MTGTQQIFRLIRKNLLLKGRRPKATCFEMCLPIVLFIILALLRRVYEPRVEFRGPFFYDSNPLFPLSSVLTSAVGLESLASTFGMGSLGTFGAGASVNLSLFSFNTSFSFFNMTTNLSAALSNITSNVEQMVLCDPSFSTYLASITEPLFAFNVSRTNVTFNRTLADELLRIDRDSAANWTRDMLRGIQDFNISAFVQQAEEARTEYLGSFWARQLEDIAARVDAELQLLRAELDAPSVTSYLDNLTIASGGPLSRAQRWLNDTCHLRGPVLEGWNTSALARELERLRDTLERSGITAWLNGTSDNTALDPIRMLLDVGLPEVNDIAIGLSSPIEAVLRGFQGMDMLTTDVSAELADKGIWWTSHFLQPDSPSMMLLDPLTRGYRGIVDMNSTWNYTFQTEAAEELLNMFRRFQREAISVQVPEWNLSTWTSRSALDVLNEAIGNLTGRNASAIVHEVLPEWEGRWREECGRINISQFNAVVLRMQQSCPFYRSEVRRSANFNFSALVRNLHSELAALNGTRLQEEVTGQFERVQREFRELVNTTIAQDAVRRFFDVAQNASEEVRAVQGTPGLVAERLSRALQRELNATFGDRARCSAERGDAYLATIMEQLGGLLPSGLRSQLSQVTPGGLQGVLGAFMPPEAAGVLQTFLPGDLFGQAEGPAAEGGEALSSRGSAGALLGTTGAGSGTLGFVTELLANRKLLLAPYHGEAKDLWDLVLVELVAGLTETGTGGVADPVLGALLRCPVVRGMIAYLGDTLIKDYVLTFRTEAELEAHARKHSDKVLAALVFRSADEATGDFPADHMEVRYAIRMHALLMPSTTSIVAASRLLGEGPETSNTYLTIGYAYLQETIGRAAARLRAKRYAQQADLTGIRLNAEAHNATAPLRKISVGAVQYPTPRYKFDQFVYVIQAMLPLFMVLGWIYAVSLLVKEMVYEKQERLREVMRIMGLRTWVYWMGWITTSMAQLGLLVLLMTALMSGGKVLTYSNPVLVFVYFMLYSGTVVSMAMLVSACFSRAKVAAVCAAVVYFASYLPYSLFARFEELLPVGAKCAFCLLSPTGMSIGINIVAQWELVEEGMQFGNLALRPPISNTGAVPKDGFSLLHVMMMMVVDMLIYQLGAWYIEKVWPGELGLPQPWYFPLVRSYWRGNAGQPAGASLLEADNGSVAEQKDNGKLDCYEAASAELPVLVRIRGLAKTFRSGKQALKGISVDMHEGTVLGLLGHNGAGKSTTMAILTGLYPPSEGDVLVNGCSVRKDSYSVRKQLGVCLQHNALYEQMTTEEHLRLFCNLKGVAPSSVQGEVDALLRDTGLELKRHAFSRSLSGGMKRKLSVGIALAGGSKVIALDEPTAGVDATARRDIWHLLASYKPGRAVLLSTHFMDEADVLSDRIAIIAEGELRAIGSSMALKRHFADSYMLTLVASDGANPSRLLAGVRKSIPRAKCVGSRGREYSFALPSSARPQFADLFAALQDDGFRAGIGVEAYGLSAATMEEVFLHASSLHEEGLHGQVRNNGSASQVEALKLPELDGESNLSTAPGSRQPSAGHDGNRSAWATRETPLSQDSGSTLGQDLGSSSGGDTPPPRENTPPIADLNRPWSPQCLNSAPEPMTRADSEPASEHDEPAECQTKSRLKGRNASRDDVKEVVIGDGSAEREDNTELLWGPMLVFQQFRALTWKHAISAFRDRRAWASQLLLPAVFVLLALVIAAVLEVREEEPPLKMSTEMFIGTIASARNEVSQHLVPFSDLRGDAMGQQMMQGFQQSMSSDDVMVDAGVNTSMAQYLLDNSKELLAGSYGAVSVAGTGDEAGINLWFKSRAHHAVPAMIHMCNNARLKLLGYDDVYTEAWSHPLPMTDALLSTGMSGASQIFTDLLVAITIILAMGFIPASFIVHRVHEKATNAKHQQLLTGVSPVLYWASAYAWDMINFLFPVVICFVLFLSFQLAAYSGANAPAILLLLLLYGFCMTPFMYCWEPLFTVSSTAYVTLICINIFTGTVSVLATATLDLYQVQMPSLTPLNDFLKAVLPWLLPNYCLGRGLMDIATNHYIRWAAEEFDICVGSFLGDPTCTRSPLQWDVAGHFLFSLAVMSCVWFLVRLLIEWRCFARQLCNMVFEGQTPKAAEQDSAVAEEAQRVAKLLGEASPEDRLLISDLCKTFMVTRWSGCCRRRAEPVHSVRGISVGVKAGECFGLLGVNGAGKTTTLRMITGDTEIGRGDISLAGCSVQTSRDRARRHLGYCPQFDALPDLLTTRETLDFYARIRGVRPEQQRATVDRMIEQMCLEAHQQRLTQQLSGGNKRKLSTALSLIGEPDVVLLDEPSTGVDVGARRFLWDVLGGVRRRGHALVLTSHSMDECEVLCTRLTIMVHGEMKCLGSPLQLKAKYGGGYTLAVKAQPDRAPQNPRELIRGFMAQSIPAAMLTEENVGLFRYRLKGADGKEVPVADVFKALEDATAKDGSLEDCILDYTVSQTSLEEVFLHFSRMGEAMDGSP